MAKRGSTAPQGRRIYLKGIGSQHALRLGAFTFKSAPQRRKKTLTKYQLYATSTLSVAASLTRELTAWERETCKEIAGNSGFTWKDQFYAMLFGTGIEFTDAQGTLWIGRRILAAEIQQLLDSISSNPGSILVRTPTAWAALFPGTKDYVLTMADIAGVTLPDWRPASGGSGGAASAFIGSTNNDSHTGASLSTGTMVGPAVVLPAGYVCKGCAIQVQTANATTHLTPALYKITSASQATLEASGPQVTGAPFGINELDFTTPFTVPATDLYIPMVMNIGSTLQVATSTFVRNAFATSLSALPSPLTLATSSSTNTPVWAVPT